ncbi:MAG: acyltransferase [Parcubacteria group bacterium]
MGLHSLKKAGSLSLLVVNFIFQRILRINGDTRWMVHYTSQVICPKKMTLGKHVEKSFARSGGCYIQGLNGIVLDDDVLFAPGVKIISANHGYTDHHEIQPSEPVRIGRNTWIGANAIILPGIQLGKNCIIGAGSVVTKSFSDNTIIVGNPAREIGKNM